MAYIWPGIPNGSTSYPSVIDQLGVQVEKTVGETGFPATNLVVNGDFSAGAAGWNANNCTLVSVSSNELITIATAQNGRYAHNLGIISGHKYYCSAWAKATSNLVRLDLNLSINKAHSGNGQYELLSLIYAAQTTETVSLRVQDARTSGWDNVAQKYFFSLDLTARFGPGNEPTAAEMDAIMSYWPNSWFDGTENLAQASKMLPYLLSAIRAKADKAQEAWITPTLLNGAINVVARPFAYRKNQFNRLEFKGALTNLQSGKSFMQLPTTYNPITLKNAMGVVLNTAGTVRTIMFDYNGNNWGVQRGVGMVAITTNEEVLFDNVSIALD